MEQLTFPALPFVCRLEKVKMKIFIPFTHSLPKQADESWSLCLSRNPANQAL